MKRNKVARTRSPKTNMSAHRPNKGTNLTIDQEHSLAENTQMNPH